MLTLLLVDSAVETYRTRRGSQFAMCRGGRIMAAIIATIYVVPEAKGWVVHGEHPSEILGRYSLKDEAISAARCIATQKQGQLVVRRSDSSVEFAEDYASVER
jgi:hypothetical protein